jgi:tol-pal system-associated acyl-CoA thioesterase
VSIFTWQVRTYWEDTDAGGIVYYANYLKFLERARSEWLRARGLSQRALALDPGVVFSVVALEAQYLRPARLDDVLAISCEPALNGAASIRFEQAIRRDSSEGELLLTANVRVACLDAQSLKPKRLPEVILRELRKL